MKQSHAVDAAGRKVGAPPPARGKRAGRRASWVRLAAASAGASLLAALAVAACAGAEIRPTMPIPGVTPEYEESRGYDAGAALRPSTAGPPGEGVYNNVPPPIPTGPPGTIPAVRP